MTGLRYSPLHVTELCGEMRGSFKVGCARLISVKRPCFIDTEAKAAIQIIYIFNYLLSSNF